MNSISESQIAIACQIASQVYAKHLKVKDGIALLSNYGIKSGTASGFIGNYKCLVDGKEFRRILSQSAMRHFIEQIHKEHGEKGTQQAIKSLRAHIRYYEQHYKKNTHAMRTVVESFEALTQGRAEEAELQREFQAQVNRSRRDSQVERVKRLALADKKPRAIPTKGTTFLRNPDVVAEALFRANGVCERCHNEAPFRRALDGTPYLEVHHKKRLADDGEDSLDNAIALCPNCHRQAHYGEPEKIDAVVSTVLPVTVELEQG
ncbi:HNH endonuclease [Azonexus sp. IMCC34842]|uniref:HNH endonuclease n=1 Tax=Azonexus sp. IMCC34842 TaxID=3420950 RepID=UPI003D0FDDD0